MAWASRETPSEQSHGRLAPTNDQVKWIKARDAVGVAIDQFLATQPAPPLRHAIRMLEGDLARLDRVAGL